MKLLSVSTLTFIAVFFLEQIIFIESVSDCDETLLQPVVLLPGYDANRFEAKLNREEVRYDYCKRQTNGYYNIWLNKDDYDEKLVYCFMDNMTLRYNRTTRRTSNQPGVFTRAPLPFGETEPLEYKSPDHNLPGSPLFNVLVQRLVDLGYQRGVNLFGASFDFRKAPNELSGYFKQLKLLVESVYLKNECQPVVIMCHSMGCLNALYFLNSRDKQWKDEYISALITLSGSIGGSVTHLTQYVAGSNTGIATLPNLKRTDTLTWPSTALLLPSSEVFPADQVLVRDTVSNFTVNDYGKLFDRLRYPDGYQIYLDVKDVVNRREAPGVEVHCFHGYNIETTEQLVYNSSKLGKAFNSDPTLVYGDGDGTNNLVSLRGCLQWRSGQVEPVYYRNFSSVNHNGLLTDENVFEYIKAVLQIDE